MDWQFWNYFLWSLVNQPVKWEPGFSSQGKVVTRIERGRFSLPKAGDIHYVPPDMRHLISLPKIHQLNLVIRKQQTDPNRGKFYKITGTTSKCSS